MKVIIVGAGRTGRNIIKKLRKEKHDIVAIDTEEELLSDIMAEYDVQCITGNGCDEKILIEAGVRDADLLISVTDKDELNLLCCIIARTYGVTNLIAHVRDPNYYFQFDSMKETLGITLLVNPEATLADEVANLLNFPSAIKVSSFAKGRLQIAEMKATAEHKLCGKTLIELKSNSKMPFLIVAVERKGNVFIPNGNTVIEDGDVVSICAKHYEMRDVLSHLGFGKYKIRSVMILGSDDDAYYLAKSLLSAGGFTIKIIGKNADKCLEMKEKLDKANVVCSDFTDKDVLDREGIEHADALVAMSSYDENNIVSSFYAKSKGVTKVITILHKDSYNGILSERDFQDVVSPYDLTGSEIAKCVRSIDVPKDSKIIAMQPIMGGKAEGLVFNVGRNPEFVGHSIRDLNVKMKDGLLVVAISRESAKKNEMSVIPDGSTMLEDNDNILIASVGRTISKLEDLLKA